MTEFTSNPAGLGRSGEFDLMTSFGCAPSAGAVAGARRGAQGGSGDAAPGIVGRLDPEVNAPQRATAPILQPREVKRGGRGAS
ncbi:MAG: hypothetical protein HUU38_31550 [Anaerolineales bacterium]|nr:hypothetical protein [Anaerolineales bacterium]